MKCQNCIDYVIVYYNLQVVCATRNKHIDNISEVENINSLSVPILCIYLYIRSNNELIKISKTILCCIQYILKRIKYLTYLHLENIREATKEIILD